ncbi:fibronectin type III domain-containing protein [Candidatus Poriferisodalis sp.]|uniref:fibronectin type III domain-containing protein n=1 Tax=Candidatus Poriferisodalis sp. TaxID=3101277 RepID=UPI003AF50B13
MLRSQLVEAKACHADTKHEDGQHRFRSRCRAVGAMFVLAAVFAVAAFPQAAAAQVPQPPLNGDCAGTAVLAKLSVVEDRAAANMLAAAVTILGLGQRCLVDAGDPTSGRVPPGSRNELSKADRVFVVGGPAAIPHDWLTSTLGVSNYTRIAGGNRWDTQSAAVSAIFSLVRGAPVVAYAGQPSSTPQLPPNTGCAIAVAVKLSVVEDRAAANMLAEAFNNLSANGDGRCLVDVGDPSTDTPPSSKAKDDYDYADAQYVVGGPAAIPTSWMSDHFSGTNYVRLEGADRWATQGVVASRIVGIAPPAADYADVVLDPLFPDPLLDVGFEQADPELDITVHYCGPSGAYDLNKLTNRVQQLNEVSHFFRRQSNRSGNNSTARADITFTRGKILTLTAADWQGSNLGKWSDDGTTWKCMSATGDPTNRKILILAHVDRGDLNGFAHRGGPAVVATLEMRGNQLAPFLGTVAHEIGHAFYHLSHPWVDHPELCDHIDQTNISKQDRIGCADSRVDEGLEQWEIVELLESLLSYTSFDSKRDVREIAVNDKRVAAYIACYQLGDLGWIDETDCTYRAFVPRAPVSPLLNSEIEAVSVAWSAPEANGAEIEGYDLQYRSAGRDNWQDWPFRGVLRSTRITGLEADTAYHVRVRARNRIGPGGWSGFTEKSTLPSTELRPRVNLSRGDRVQGRSDCTGDACYWLRVEIENFPDGAHTLACAHNGVHQIGVSRGVYRSYNAAVSNDRPSTRDCLFGYPDNEIFVIVGAELRDSAWHGGTHSNVLDWLADDEEIPPGALLNDRPELTDAKGAYTWWKPPSDVDRQGFGSNGFHFTLAIGNSGTDLTDNMARWEFDPDDGQYDVQVWIPSEWATAHVQYRISSDGEYVGGPWLDQASVSGWQSLGLYHLSGRVRIEVRDTNARDDYNDVGPINARLAVDALQLIPTNGGSSTTTSRPQEVYDDNPVLTDRSGEYTWWKPPADIDRLGYGSNGFHFTLAIGNSNDDDLDDWARWEFDAVDGAYDVEVWIPSAWATAHIQYLIWSDANGDGIFSADEYVAGPWLDQASVSGWQSLGSYDLEGRVRIEVRDTRARDDYNDVGTVNARLAVDAIRLRSSS